MATLAADSVRTFVPLGTDKTEHPVVAADIIYEGAAVGLSAGNARPLVALDLFLGFAHRKADNSAGAAGDVKVEVRAKGTVRLAIATIALADVGVPIYAVDDDTFTETAAGNSFVGRVRRVEAAGIALVDFDATLVQA